MLAAIAFTLLAAAPQTISRDIPNATWEPIFFGDTSDPQSINGRAKLSGLPSLREKRLAKGEVELRFWQGFGITYLEGYRLRFDGTKWTAWKLEPAIPGRKDLMERKYLTALKAPAAGWQAFWKQVEGEGIYTLPDFESLPGPKATVLDGMCYVVEFQKAGKYRTYCYDNPTLQPQTIKEVGNILQIAAAFRKAFP